MGRVFREFGRLRPHVRLLWYFVVFQVFFLAIEVAQRLAR
jgi:hypothetical protein